MLSAKALKMSDGKAMLMFARWVGQELLRQDWRLLCGGLILAVFVTIALIPSYLAPFDPLEQNFAVALSGPSGLHPLGADELGRDILSRVIFGARYSLLIAGGAIGLAAMVGTAMGVAAGYLLGKVDEIVMRLMDVLMAFPGILLAIAIAAALGPGVTNVTVAVGVYSIPIFARISRGSTLSIAQEEFVLAARMGGARDVRIVLRHILPNIVPTVVLTQFVLRLGIAILSAAGLGFLGLGVQPPIPEWGAMMGSGRAYIRVAPHIIAFPGLAIVLLVLGFNLIGDWLQDMMDPRLRREMGT
ncbi:MAG: ABC transporter permease [Chloroflexi bacterium]|nr:ABC transporter permease [Chloroflexota bacterium]